MFKVKRVDVIGVIHPPWMKSLVKKSHFNEKKLLYKCFVKKTEMLNKGGFKNEIYFKAI